MLWFLGFAVAVAVNLVSGGISIYQIIKYLRLNQKQHQKFQEMSVHGMPADVLERMHRFTMGQIGMDVEFMERLEIDLSFLHEEFYNPDASHRCPICQDTIPRLEKLVTLIKTIQVEFHQEP